ncbi:two-component system sensor histidine kinase PmrB [Acinetobacter apis]|uniref:histidine kinase n=1 Tax=Acinetobacter apis TaxID=1229165 RepID=A0A217ED40_9GAMM|nr:ATP-binding protein [Acinetobacter apis]SNQ28202.1 two-component system, OmpR family, sensor kinase/two-component system, OmpR family, sensor histidine kinase QseC [Acinetobacter apis]
MNKKRSSLNTRLIVMTSLLSVIVAGVLMFSTYHIAMKELTRILDAQMEFLASRATILELRNTHSQLNLDPKKEQEELFIDIWSYDDLEELEKNPLLVPQVKKAGFYQHETDSGTWYTYVLPAKDYQVQISQHRKVREVLALELAGSMVLPFILIMPFVMLIIVCMIKRSLKPLDDLKSELAQRDSSELSHVSDAHYPIELLPAIHEINYLFDRICKTQQEQKQFIADAAHELRTPLTALNLQTKILLRDFPDNVALINLNKGLARIQHLVSQLLALAKQDTSLHVLEQPKKVSLNQVALNCVEQLMNLAMEKNIDLGFERNEEIHVQSYEPTLHSIIYNLIDNAIKYTPHSGVINISVYPKAGKAVLCIEDSGPGIPKEQYEAVLKRFYRVHHHLEVGSGLGLSIVQKAIQRVGGQLSFDQSQDLGGLKVVVVAPINLHLNELQAVNAI